MDIHINVARIHIEVEKIGHLLAHGNEALVGLHHSFVEIGMLHIAPINKEILVRTFFACCLRFAHKSRNFTHHCVDVEGQKVLIEPLSKDVNDALPWHACTQIKQECGAVAQGEVDVGVDQGNAFKGRDDVVELGGVRL